MPQSTAQQRRSKTDWYLMGNQRSLSGFEREEFFDDSDVGFDELLEFSMLGVDVVLYQYALDEDTAIHTKAIVQGNSPNSPQAFDHRQIISRRGTLKAGAYVKYQDSYWLIYEVPGDNQIYEKAVMRQCNYLLRWVNMHGVVVERWAHWREGMQNLSGILGIDGNRYMITPHTRSIIFLPKDSETENIRRGQRFIVDDYNSAQHNAPLVFSITRANRVQKSQGDEYACYHFMLDEDTFNPATDNAELMIADYFTAINTLEIITPTNLEIKIGQGAYIQFIAKSSGTVTKDSVYFESDNTEIATVTEDGQIQAIALGDAKIKVTFYHVAKEITVRVTEINKVFQDTAKISFNGELILRIGGTKTFKANFFDGSGKPMADTPVWSVVISGTDTVPDFITVEKQANGAVQLKCNNDIRLLGRSIDLRLTGASGMVVDVVQFTIESLT